ncbi:hypothetical protein H0H93_008629 [Arthromyces matolae]|nr:hypothetical protein H0H93_008629 [Arthromyces matolae]
MAPTVQDTVINGQNRGESMSQQQSSIASTLTPRNNTVHAPPLHPHNDSSQPSISPFGHSSVTEIVLIVGGALIICVLGIIALAIMRSTILKKTLRLLSACGPRHTNNTGKSKSMADDKGSIVQCDDFDTLTLGTATRFVYVEGLQADLEDRPISTVPFHPGESVSSSMSSGKVFRPKPQVSLFSDGIQCPLEGEENSHDIAFAPVQALSDAFPASVVTTNLRDKEENSSLNYLGKSTLSHAGIATPGWAFGSRSSNDYAASVSSPETPASICDSVGSFSIASSKQSLTCLSSLESTECDLDEDVVFEFRRAQAQSLELKKGVLVTCGSRFGDDADASIDSLPTLIISGAAPHLQDDQNLAHWFSANNSLPSMRSHPVFGEAPSWSSIVRQQSSGTISLLASVSTKHIEQWCPEDTQYLHPSIPILMLTRPSDSSLRTAESFASSVSLDLCDFPFPPEPASGLCVYNKTMMSLIHFLTGLLVFVGSSLLFLALKMKLNPLHQIAGPPVTGWFKNHLFAVLEPSVSPLVHEKFVEKYGRSFRIRGVGPIPKWDERLLTLDPASVAHVLKNSSVYEKPWQSRRLITSLIGCGMLSAEGPVHKRQRRVATPAFSIQNMRALVPIVFRKGAELKERWSIMIADESCKGHPLKIDVCHWVSRATFDVIGAADQAGFDYEFSAIKDETNELFCAYKEMFEVAISQGNPARTLLNIYLPSISRLFPDKIMRTVERCQNTIHKVASQLIQENKRKLHASEKTGSPFLGKDLLSLLMKSNAAIDLPPEQRISDEDILHNINTFMFAGSDTSSLSVTWTLLLLAQHPEIQSRLREELLAIAAPCADDLKSLTEDEIQSLYENIANLPYLDNVCRESLRLIPPVHSSIRVATQDDEVPTSYPVHGRDGTVDVSRRSITIPKGSFVHVAIEGLNLDKGIWGEDAWKFCPDRWNNLPETAAQQPGLYSNTLTFSAGPRLTDEKVIKANVSLINKVLAF